MRLQGLGVLLALLALTGVAHVRALHPVCFRVLLEPPIARAACGSSGPRRRGRDAKRVPPAARPPPPCSARPIQRRMPPPAGPPGPDARPEGGGHAALPQAAQRPQPVGRLGGLLRVAQRHALPGGVPPPWRRHLDAALLLLPLLPLPPCFYVCVAGILVASAASWSAPPLMPDPHARAPLRRMPTAPPATSWARP